MDLQKLTENVGLAVEVVGVAVIVLGALASSLRALARLFRQDTEHLYEEYRRHLGRSILLGLEFLVAGDIIRTVAIAPTFQSVGVLGVIVLIRTFLSFSLELEITGKWPWEKNDSRLSAKSRKNAGEKSAPAQS